MNSGPVAERVYDALRRRLLHGEWRPGERLDPVLLSATLASSSTPVRDALNRLTGEQLVETRLSGGFFVPAVDEPGLIDLLGWHGELLSLAVRNWPPGAPRLDASAVELPPGGIARPPATARWTLFIRIAELSPNLEHRSAQARAAARLHPASMVEDWTSDQVSTELAAIGAAAGRGDRARLRVLLAGYHRRRQRIAALLVRRLYREAPVETPR